MNNTPAAKKRPSFILIAVIGFIGLCAFCIISSLTMDALGLLPTSTPSPVLPTSTNTPPLPTAIPTQPRTPIDELKFQIEQALGDGNRDISRLTEFNWSETDQSLIIVFAINDNFTSDLIMVGMQTDVTDMLKVISEGGFLPEYQFVTFVGTFPLRDNFGNVSEERVLTVSYNKTTVNKINWQNFLYTDVFDIADAFNIHPAMTVP